MRKGSMVASGVGQAILAASLSCSATLASAQEASKLGPQAARIEGEGRITGDIVRRVVYAYATCVVRHRRLKVIKWIALPRTDPDLSRKAYDFADDTCLENGDLQFSPLVLRGAIYSALYLAQFGRGGALSAPSLTAVATGNGAPVLTPEEMLSQFAACVTRRDPAGVRDFVLATPATDHEDEALAAITPQFGSCVVQGSKLQINKATLASYLAEALYLQATSPASVAIAGAPR